MTANRDELTMNTVDDLSETAQIAYRAFLDMRDSKSAHFSHLEAIENKYQSGGAPSVAENLQLEKLLAEHDKNVQAFQAAMAAVKKEEQKILVQLMS